MRRASRPAQFQCFNERIMEVLDDRGTKPETLFDGRILVDTIKELSKLDAERGRTDASWDQGRLKIRMLTGGGSRAPSLMDGEIE